MSRWPFSLYNDAASALDRHVGWDKLPKPVAMLVLIGLRNVLREKNLYDTGRGPLDKPRRLRPPALPDRAHARRHLQRPRRPADGQPRQPLRAQRAARTRRCASRDAARAEPAHGQPRAADPRRVHPGDDAEPARRRVDPVRGARLVQPRQERDREPVARRRSPTTTRGPSTRCRSSARGATRAANGDGPPTFITDDTHWWDGSQIYGRDPAFAEAIRTRRARQAAARRPRPDPAGDRGARRPDRRRRQLLGRARAAALAVHARAQRDLRPPARDASRAAPTTSCTTRRGSSSRR